MDRRGRRAIAGAVGLLSLIGDGSVGTARLAIQGLGLDVDFVPPGATLENYRFVLAPSLRTPAIHCSAFELPPPWSVPNRMHRFEFGTASRLMLSV
jgi:hypothetical protein